MLNERNDGYQKLIDYQNLFFILNMFTKKRRFPCARLLYIIIGVNSCTPHRPGCIPMPETPFVIPHRIKV